MATLFGMIGLIGGILIIVLAISIKEVVLAGPGALICVGGMFVGIGGNSDGGAGLVILGLIAIAAGVIIMWRGFASATKFEDRLRPYMTFDSKKEEISVKKRGGVFREALKIVEVHDTIYAHEPEKIHFGAVTVGGVTTGGTYKTGGYTYAAGSKKTGKYQLVSYLDKVIYTIRLTPELANEARQSSIKNYVDSSGVIKAIIKPDSAHIPDYAAGNEALTMDIIKRQVLAGYPTYEKCKEILDWLSQE